MRKVAIRQFQQNFHKELKSLPFEITRNGEVIATVENQAFMETKTNQRIPVSVNNQIKAMDILKEWCEIEYIIQGKTCPFPGVKKFVVPEGLQHLGNSEPILCESHFKQVSVLS